MPMRGRQGIAVVLSVSALGVTGLIAVLKRRSIPLGVPGEWEWNRLSAGIAPTVLEWLIGVPSVIAFAIFCALGYAYLSRRPRVGMLAETGTVLTLGLASVATQYGVQESAPKGFGLSKWTFAQHA